jgi:hypothetical protein
MPIECAKKNMQRFLVSFICYRIQSRERFPHSQSRKETPQADQQPYISSRVDTDVGQDQRRVQEREEEMQDYDDGERNIE